MPTAAADFSDMFTVLYNQLRAPRKPADTDMLAILGLLQVTGPMTISALMRKLGMRQVTLVTLLDDLTRQKLVTGSTTHYYLDDAGHRFLQREGAVLARAKLNKAIGRMRPKDRNQLVAGMRLLVEVALRP
jgi:hypothetical protein